MKDKNKAKKELINELIGLRQRIAELEKSEVGHKQMEEALREGEEKFRDISATAKDGIIMMDNDGNIAYWNDAAERIFGYTKEEAIGKGAHTILAHERYHEAFRKGFSIFKETGHGPVIGKTLELSAIKKNGTEFPIELSVSAVKTVGKWHSIGMARDITERKQAEEVFCKNEEKFRTVADWTYDWEYWISPEAELLYISPSVERITGYSAEEFRREPDIWSRIVYPEDKSLWNKHQAAHFAKATNEVSELDFRILNRDGIIGWIHHICRPVFSEDGRFLGRRVSNRDITERKRMEEALRDSEGRYRLLFNGITDAVYVHEVSVEKPGKFFAVNDSACRMLGYTRDEFLQMEVKDIDVREQAEKLPSVHEKLFRDGYALFEGCHVAKDGRRIPVEINIQLFELQGKSMVLAVARDITERKQAEKMLEKKSEEQTLLLDNIPTLIWYLKDVETHGIVNKAYANFFGKKKEKLENKKLHDFMSKEEAEICIARNKEVFEKKFTIHTEEWTKNAKGEKRLIAITKTPKMSENGNVEYVVCSAEDITEHKRAAEALQRAEQLQLAGELATGLAHELRNSLTGIDISIEVLLDELVLSEDDQRVLMNMLNETRRIEFLMKDLLDYARPSNPHLAFVNINAVLDAALKLSVKNVSTLANHGRSIDVVKEFDYHIPGTIADQMQLQQIFMNLLLNAVEAMQNGGSLKVQTSYDVSNDLIHISISDTGKGIDHKLIDKIFEPFFTTKPKGTGLGLSISKRLIEQHGGNIRVETSLGKGTTFNIVLPVKQFEESKIT
jgi:PAS domain S-box-containing protein